MTDTLPRRPTGSDEDKVKAAHSRNCDRRGYSPNHDPNRLTADPRRSTQAPCARTGVEIPRSAKAELRQTQSPFHGLLALRTRGELRNDKIPASISGKPRCRVRGGKRDSPNKDASPSIQAPRCRSGGLAQSETMPTCRARTRSGGLCRNRPVPGKRRCRFHGGASTGPRTLEGKAAIARAQKIRWNLWRARRQTNASDSSVTARRKRKGV